MTSTIVRTGKTIDGGDIGKPAIVRADELQYGQAVAGYRPSEGDEILEVRHVEPTDAGERLVVFAGGRFDIFQADDEFHLVSDVDRDNARKRREERAQRRDHVALLDRVARLIESGDLPIPTDGLRIYGDLGTHEQMAAAAKALDTDVTTSKSGCTSINFRAGADRYSSPAVFLSGPNAEAGAA